MQQAEKSDNAVDGLPDVLMSEKTFANVEAFYGVNEVLADALVRLVCSEELQDLAYELSGFSRRPVVDEIDTLAGILLKRCSQADKGITP